MNNVILADSFSNHNIIPFVASQVENPFTFDQIIHGHGLIPRANSAEKGLSKTARMLASTYRKMIDRSMNGVIALTHDFISKTTETGRRNNNLIHKQLTNIFNIESHQVYYHQTIDGEKKLRDVCVISFTENGRFILDNPPQKREKIFPLSSKKFPELGKKISHPYIVDNNNIKIIKKDKDREDEKTVLKEVIAKEAGVSTRGCKAPDEIPKTKLYEKFVHVEAKSESDLSFNLNNLKSDETTTMTTETLPEKGKLKDFYPLAESDHDKLKELSERRFSLDEMNSILLKLSEKLKDHSFSSRDQFLRYMGKILRNEKQQEGNVKQHKPATEKEEVIYEPVYQDNLWGKTRERLVEWLGAGTDKSWFSKLELEEINQEHKMIYLKAPSAFVRDWMNSNYHNHIKTVISEFGYDCQIILEGEEKHKPTRMISFNLNSILKRS